MAKVSDGSRCIQGFGTTSGQCFANFHIEVGREALSLILSSASRRSPLESCEIAV